MKKIMFVILMMPLMAISQTMDTTLFNALYLEQYSGFWTEMFGIIPQYVYCAGSVFLAIGVLISWYLKSKKGQKTNLDTPYNFSWKLFLFSKLPRKVMSIIVNILIGFVIMRFSSEILGLPLTMSFCLVAGLTFDRIVIMISKLKLPIK